MRKLATLMACAVVGVLSFSQPASADVISLRADAWCPYNCSPADAKPGYIVEIVKEIFEKAGHKIDYQTLNWARALDNVKNGEFVGVIGAAKEDAPELIFPKLPAGKSTNTFALRNDDPFEYKDISSLEGKLLGVIDGYAYTDVINDYIAKNKNNNKRIMTASGDNALSAILGKLVAKKVDLIIEDGNVLNSEIVKLKLDDKLRVLKDPLPIAEIYVAFSPKNPKAGGYADLFDRGLAELRASGKLAEILAKYNVKDWQ